MTAWTISQTESLKTANNWGKPWTRLELDLVEGSMHEKTADVAYVLERTIYSISTMRNLLRAGYTVDQIIDGPKTKIQKKAENICSVCHMVTPLSGICC